MRGSLIDRHRESHPPSRRLSSSESLKGNINQRIITIYAEQSKIHLLDEPARRRHWAQHPTYFACTKCMDGRVHLPQMTRTPTGLVKPFRCIGGRFETFWPAFLDKLDVWVEKAMGRGSRCFVFVTYHFSASNPQLGCAGWEYDTSSARSHAVKLSQDLHEIFGDQLLAVPTGVETDSDGFILHGPRGDVSGERLVGLDADDIRTALRRCLPELDDQTLQDLLPFLIGNAGRVAELKSVPRDLSSLGHHERVIAVGEAFNSLALQNFALITNDTDPNLDEAIAKAAGIIEANLLDAAPGDEATIFTNASYDHPGKSLRKAMARSRGLQEFAQWVIRERSPRLWKSGRLRYLVGTTFEPSKELKILDEGRIG